NLGLPTPFEVALLYWAQCGIDDDKPDVVFGNQLAKIFDSPAAKQTTRPRACDCGDLRAHHIETDCLGEPDRFFQPCLDRAAGNFTRMPSGRVFWRRMHDERSTRRAPIDHRCSVCPAQDSAISLFCSKS